MSSYARSHRELLVYRRAFRLQQDLFRATKGFPIEERYSLVSQLRRSSRSVGSSIAEAWRKRRYVAHFVSKLTDADSELAETQHWLDTARACDYIPRDRHRDLTRSVEEIGAMLGSMIRGADRWCARLP